MRLERLNIDIAEWEQRTKHLSDRTVFQSSAWLSFLATTQHGEPVFAALMDSDELVGYFCGMIVRKFGIPILGSPMPGWTTAYMGTNVVVGIPRRLVLQAITTFAFKELGCLHLEMMDRHLTDQDIEEENVRSRAFRGFELDLTPAEEALKANMSSACRNNLRKAIRSGLQIRECGDADFVDHYYAQLEDVFAKRRLVPTYNKERVQELVRHLLPEGKILPLQAIEPEGQCIASMITVASNDTAFLWGSASWRRFQILRPNELLMWSSIKYWKARGIRKLDMGGAGEYKRKYGGSDISVPWLRVSKYAGLDSLRSTAAQVLRLQQRLRGFSKNPSHGTEELARIPAHRAA
jgi:CelD/BcsL family acetyltransferase involved in cellulose biosynthesis